MDKLLNGLQHLHIERLGLNPTQVHVTQEAVDDLQQGLLHAGEAFVQQLSTEGRNTASEFDLSLVFSTSWRPTLRSLARHGPRPCR